MTVQGYASPQEKTLYHDGAIETNKAAGAPLTQGRLPLLSAHSPASRSDAPSADS